MKEILPIIAIVISAISLSVSMFLAIRDRGIVKTESMAYKNSSTEEYAVVYLKVVNVGRRPITLRYLWGNYEGGYSSGCTLGDGLIKLNEGDFYEERIGKYDGMMIHMGEHGELNAMLVDLYVEDTKGKLYTVKNSKQNISKVLNSKHPLSVRTHS